MMKKFLAALSIVSLGLGLFSCKQDGPEVPEKKTVSVTLIANNGTELSRTLEIVPGKTMGEPSWNPAMNGHTFAWWCFDKEGTQPVDFETFVLEEPITLYGSYSRDIVLSGTKKISRVTGENLAGEALPNPNHTQVNWNVGGTDLGIIWEMSDGNYGVAFGDTFNTYNEGGDWRSNVIGFSNNTDLDNGLKFYGMMTDPGRPNRARPIMERENYWSFTYIPTAAICLDGVEYVHIMYWEVGSGAHVTEGYSTFWKSTDACRSWQSCRGMADFAPDSFFGMVGLAKRDGDPYCYMMGAQTGQWGGNGKGYRQSPAKLARFKYSDILNKSKYEYWNGGKGKWVKGKESEATVMLDGTVGELGLIWLEDYQRWLVMYFDSEQYAICYRTAAKINGPWSIERVLCSGHTAGYSQLYGSFPHPASSKGNKIYWNMSLWAPYNVFFMRSDVSYAK